MASLPANISLPVLQIGQFDHVFVPLIEAALMAGTAIMDIYKQETAIIIKDDGSPVTQADHQAETIIISILSKAFPNIPIVAEEQMATGINPTLGDMIFLVDPLDGTKEFIAQTGEFTVNIALIEKGNPVAGVVYAPALGCLYCGAASDTAMIYNIHEGIINQGMKISVRACENNIFTIVTSRSHPSPQINKIASIFDHTTYKTVGSSLKFCLIAAGEADLYLRFGQTMEWDTAAGDAILRAAGGQVLDLDGIPLSYNKPYYTKPYYTKNNNFSNPHFLAIGSLDCAKIIHAISTC